MKMRLREIAYLVIAGLVLIGSTRTVFAACYSDETQANKRLIQTALGNAEQCVNFPYLKKYSYSLEYLKNNKLPMYHAGIDLKASIGTQAYSIVKGKVKVACDRDGQGNCGDSYGLLMIELEGTPSIKINYLHMSQVSVKVGDTVRVGDKVGKTGARFNYKPNGADPHLHIEVRRNYNGSSAVGWISCGGGCDTRNKVAAITSNPVDIVGTATVSTPPAQPTSCTTDPSVYDHWVKAAPIYAGTPGGFDAQFKLKNSCNSKITLAKVAMAIHRKDGSYSYVDDMRITSDITIAAGGSYQMPFTAVNVPSPAGEYEVVAKIYKKTGEWIHLSEKPFTVLAAANQPSCTNPTVYDHWVKAAPIYAGTPGGFDAQFKLKNSCNSKITLAKVAMAIHRKDGSYSYVDDMRITSDIPIAAGGTYHLPSTAVNTPSPAGEYKVVAKIYKKNGEWIHLSEKPFTVLQLPTAQTPVQPPAPTPVPAQPAPAPVVQQPAPQPSMKITVTNPTAGKEWDSDEEHAIRWTTENVPSSNQLRIELSLNDGASWMVIHDNTSNDGKKNWYFGKDKRICSDTDRARIKIIVIDQPEVMTISPFFKIDHKKGYPSC